MISVTLIVTIVAIALGLLLLEILVVPGIGIPGIVGTTMLVVSVVIAYQIDDFTGHTTLAATAILAIILGFVAFNNKTWSKMAQNEEITSRVSHNETSLQIGQIGKTTSRLNPIGNAMFDDKIFEISTRGEYMEEAKSIEIVSIEAGKIIVKSV